MSVPPASVPAILRTLTLGSADWETRGVLRPRAQPPGTPARFAPAADLSGFVDIYWIASWDLAPGEIRVVETLPHPCVNVVVDPGWSLVHGPVKGRFTRALAGRGRVVSARLRPGAFRAFCERPAWRLVDAVLDFPAAFGAGSEPLERAVLAQTDERAMVSALEQFLRERLPPADPAALELAGKIELIDRIFGRITADREIVRVEDLAAAVAVGRRTLERLFREYVGPSPKWVIRQYRLQAAADEAARGQVANWSRLASDLGYADQAHFNRDFRAILGTTPAEFARQAVPPQPPPGTPAA